MKVFSFQRLKNETPSSRAKPNSCFSLKHVSSSCHSHLIAKEDHLNRRGHGVGDYINQGFPFERDAKKRGLLFPIYFFSHVTLIHSATFVFVLYRPLDDGTVTFDRITERTDNFLTEFPSASFHISGDFNIHHKEWFVRSNRTDGRRQILLGLLHRLWTDPNYQRNPTASLTNLLVLFLTSCPDGCLAKVLTPLGTSDHSIVSRLMTNQRHPLICRSTEQFFAARRAAFDPIWCKLLSHPSSVLVSQLTLSGM